MLRAAILGAAFVLSLTVGASAADMPTFDARTYCDRLGQMAGGSYMIVQGCLENERTSYAEVQAKLPRLEPKILQYCEHLARTGGGSYMLLSGCIQNEESSRNALKNGSNKAPF